MNHYSNKLIEDKIDLCLLLFQPVKKGGGCIKSAKYR